jgi:hypothetical protein
MCKMKKLTFQICKYFPSLWCFAVAALLVQEGGLDQRAGNVLLKSFRTQR